MEGGLKYDVAMVSRTVALLQYKHLALEICLGRVM